jgi:hypothetical protein
MKKILFSLFVVGCSLLFLPSCTLYSDAEVAPNNNGKSGSITKFTVVENYLYALSDNKIVVYDISDKNNMINVGSTTVAYNIETIFSFANRLYIGATDGVFIVDITDKTKPVVQSKAMHFVGCDPAIAKANVAYSTVRTGTVCNNNFRSNGMLVVYDVTDALYPSELTFIVMEEPQGLSYDGNTLFVCNGNYGVHVYDITDNRNPEYLTKISDINAVDVIAENNLLIVSSPSGYTFCDYTDLNNIRIVKTINKN